MSISISLLNYLPFLSLAHGQPEVRSSSLLSMLSKQLSSTSLILPLPISLNPTGSETPAQLQNSPFPSSSLIKHWLVRRNRYEKLASISFRKVKMPKLRVAAQQFQCLARCELNLRLPRDESAVKMRLYSAEDREHNSELPSAEACPRRK